MMFRRLAYALLILALLLPAGLVPATAGASPAASQVAFKLFHPVLQKNHYGWNSFISIQNTSALPAQVSLDTSSGAHHSATIPPKGTLAMPGAAISGLPDGISSLVVSSDQLVESVIELTTGAGDKLMSYRGIPQGQFNGYLSPMLRGDLTSGSNFYNPGPANATFLAFYYDSAGSLGGNSSGVINPNSTFSVFPPPLPNGTYGWAAMQADNPLISLSNVSNASNTYREYKPGQDPATRQNLPRALKNVDEGGGPRTTSLYIANTVTTTASVQVFYLDAGGSAALNETFNLGGSASLAVNLGAKAALADGVYAVTVVSNQPVLLSDITHFTSGSSSYAHTAYPGGSGTPLYLPRLILDQEFYSIPAVQNIGAAAGNLAIQYYKTDGSLAHTQNFVVPAGGFVRPDLRSLEGTLGKPFIGSAVVSCDQPLVGLVDEYQAPPPPPTYKLYHPMFSKNFYGYNSTLALQNTTGTPAAVTLGFSSGSPMTGTIPAMGALILPAAAISSLPDGYSWVIVTSTQPLRSVVLENGLNGDRLAAYPGILQGSQVLYSLPTLRGGIYTSGLNLWNIDPTAANTAMSFFRLDGSLETFQNDTIPAGSQKTYFPFTNVPAGFTGWLETTTNRPLMGLNSLVGTGSAYREYQPTRMPAPQQNLPRALKNVDEGGGPRSTTFFIANAFTGTTNVALYFYHSDGTHGSPVNLSLPAHGEQVFDMKNQASLPDGVYAIAAAADHPILLGEYTDYQAPSPFSHAAYPATAGNAVYLPRLVRSPAQYSILSLQNVQPAAASVDITYLRPDGSTAHTQAFNLPAGGWLRQDLRLLSQLGDPFTGAAIVTSNQPLDALVDEYLAGGSPALAISKRGPASALAGELITYTITVSNPGNLPAQAVRITDTIPSGAFYVRGGVLQGGKATWNLPSLAAGATWQDALVVTATQTITNGTYEASAEGGLYAAGAPPVVTQVSQPCQVVSNVQISRFPAGDLFTGDTVQFTASAEGDLPFSYTWRVDGNPAGQNQSTLATTFGTGLHTVDVTVSNICSQAGGTTSFTVQPATPGQPNLSTSFKRASRSNVQAGDTLSYTLSIRNTGTVVATAVLTDPLPAYTTYITGSAFASDGSPVTFEDGSIYWNGQVYPGTPLIIEFAVTIGTAQIGEALTNQARLSDGAGHSYVLEASAIYNPGYLFTINDGALYTSIPTVTLRYAWNTADNISEVRFSNDGGFSAQGGTTAWLPVSAADPTYPGWVLSTYGDLKMPRTAYVQFRDGSGKTFGPFQDDIIYDPVAPQVTQVQIITQTTGLHMARMLGRSVIVRVLSADDNSGVSEVQISNTPGFEQYTTFTISGSQADIPWTLQPSGLVYVRVVDRAGNTSAVENAEGGPQYDLYMPITRR